jgi:tetratricopeptide (TPR) repeat protein
MEDKEILLKLAASIESLEKTINKPTKRDNLPLIIALISSLVSVLAIVFTQWQHSQQLNSQHEQLIIQAENDLIELAFNSESASAKKSNLVFLNRLGLLPRTGNAVREMIDVAFVTSSGDLIYSDETDPFDLAYEHFLLGKMYLDSNRHTAAVSELKKSIKLDSTFSDAHFFLGYSSLQLNKYKDAIKAFKACNRCGYHNMPSLYWNLGYCYDALAGENSNDSNNDSADHYFDLSSEEAKKERFY